MSEETARDKTALRIEPIDEKSPHLPAVIALGRANKRTLGLFPDEAFVDRAAAREILVAIAAEEEVSEKVSEEVSEGEEKFVGYLLYRSVPSEKHIVIVHLCIDLSWRGRGLAKKLVDFLSDITQDFYGIKLKCRRDYGLHKMWERLGFFPANEKPGRSRDGKELTVWWRDHGHRDLFSLLAQQKLESKLGAVMDASVFFDLESSEADNSESASLLADWLEPNLNLCVTDDIFYAVDKIEDSKQRKSQRLLAETFDRLRCSQSEFEAKLQAIADFFAYSTDSPTDSPIAKANIEETARRQLARAIAVETSVLVTRARNLLAIAEAIAAKFHLSILSPTELIVQLDEVRSKAKHPPQRLAGTNLRIQNLQNIESLQYNQPSFIENFRSRSCGETLQQFRQRLHSFQEDKDKCDRSLVLNAENKPLALIVCDRRANQELQIPMMRVKGGNLAATLVRHLIFRSVSQAADEKRPFVRISDPYLDSTAIEAIQEDAFIRVSEQYLKVNLPVAATAQELAEHLLALARLDSDYSFCQQYAETLTNDRRETNSVVAAELEHRLWPAKITDAPLQTAIVPIQAKWAKDLFDKELANQYLFASTNNLPLKRELVYYRSKRANAGLKPGAIGRILWYVSNDKNYFGTKALRACSRLDEVIVDKPETLDRQFSNFGVYELKDLLSLTKNKPKQDIMALRFSDTKVFVRPIEWEQLKQILGLQAPIQSPMAISPAQFDIIYNLGIQSERKLY